MLINDVGIFLAFIQITYFGISFVRPEYDNARAYITVVIQNFLNIGNKTLDETFHLTKELEENGFVDVERIPGTSITRPDM
ncbi:hypothetical protein C0995_000409 [Termitomyces sp. Mi166|nr:hypothetical protein C0995_000409 [Termitomyces sp. Mi166\